MMLTMFATVAEMARNPLVECSQSGHVRALNGCELVFIVLVGHTMTPIRSMMKRGRLPKLWSMG